MEHVFRTDLKLLRYFLAVAEELHFGRAAARLHMSQPPLSTHIKDLETQLGTPLFIRHSRSVVLTQAGRVLMEEARKLLTNTHLALARVEKIGRGETGRIALGLVGTALWGTLRTLIHRFMQDNPEVEITFHEQSPDRQRLMLERQQLDVGLWRMAVDPPYGLHSVRLHQAAFQVALPCQHPLAAHATVPLARLSREPFITLPAAHSDWRFLHNICLSAGFTPSIVREAVEPQTVLALISMGLGITLMADSYAQMAWPGVVFRPLSEPIPADLYAVYDEAQITPAVSRLIATLKT
ncbi:LysR family transcriptional regulator [Nissabacter archeti]|uniref:LysR family transcriptional regulator n=1 Tax=Nissabacter archeti TaxID=1917880 RepID=UPI000934CAA5|nr:LysR family transcriptional regulator [Nissabacter archeti]